MTTKIAPWLEGLSETWEPPSKTTSIDSISSASHDANSLRNSRSRIPRRSLSGLPSSLTRQNSISHGSMQQKRNPLAALSSNDANTLRRQNGTTKLAGTRSVSEASDGSSMPCGTVQLRSKSESPSKKQETLEWKRRLVNGKVGYGDQTDLFGPSGLENIFAKSKDEENEAPKPRNRMGWLQKSDASMPSSPPPWPSDLKSQTLAKVEEHGDPLEPVAEEEQYDDDDSLRQNGSDGLSRSNPFDLEVTEYPETESQPNPDTSPFHHSSSDVASIEPTQNEAPANRTISGQTELEQEDFSPVFISKHHTVTGQVDYAALDSHMIRQFQNKKVSLRHPSQEDAQASEPREQPTHMDGPDNEFLSTAPDLSFSENLPTGSPFPNLGVNIEFKRGGYSQYGSFKRRPLSPSQSFMGNSRNPNASGLLSPLPSDIDQLPPAPSPPETPAAPELSSEPKSRSSGSPLKLFGNHDTFTNNRLLRRLSQLNPDGTVRQPAVLQEESQWQPEASHCSSFGSGGLDQHNFNAEITITSASDSDKDSGDQSPGSEVPVPGSKVPVGFRFEVSSEVTDTFKLKRRLSKHSTLTSKGSTSASHGIFRVDLQPTIEDVSESHIPAEPPLEAAKTYAEGKRPPTSPFKDPTPKRRRTLHASELENEIAAVNYSYHSQLQEAVSSRKRKDARQGENHNTAEPDILAQRKILRPRNPTPSQRRRQQIEAELREAAEEFAEHEPEKLEALMEQIESSMASDTAPTLQQQAHTLASEVAAFTLKVQKPSGEQGERKRSVTTQDFFDEAMMVMNLIRAKARPQSNLGSVEETDAESFSRSVRPNGSQQNESLLQVSRPVSREGSGWRRPAPLQADARVISHLRKFQENEERDDTEFIANSIASLQVVDDEHVNDQVVVVDEHSNIRITGPLHESHRDEAATDSRPLSQRSQESTLNTQNSSGTSTGQTIGTSSTRKSENVGTLAPNAVAHLIGEQVGGMTFDKEMQRWVRVSKSPEKGHGSFLELPSNVTSDDDPFREISDLLVDEQKELRRISSPDKVMQEPTTSHEGVQQESQLPPESRTSSHETVIARPVTRDSSHIQHNHSSSVPSRYTAFASSQQEKVETRATSWSDEELAQISGMVKSRQQPSARVAATATIAHDGAGHDYEPGSRPPSDQVHHDITQRNDFASTDHANIQAPDGDEESIAPLTGLHDDTGLDMTEQDIEHIVSPKLRQTPAQAYRPATTTHRTATRQMSLRRKTLTNHFTAEAHEQSELSFVAPLPGDRMMSLSLSVSRPLSTRYQRAQVAEWQSSPSKGSSSLFLSDLPDFTVHDVDRERPSERALATRLAHHASVEVNDRYALAVKELVKTLTDVNEDEPYWEDLKQLDLHARSLASLHGLDDFCTHVSDLDVSNNTLRYLNGAPMTIRRLNARSNQLSSLTSWNHLMNLQYIDISKNNLDSFNGLGGLIHLRELRADDNHVTSLDGLSQLDGLLRLSMRRNKLREVDFRETSLQCLTTLDLCGNQITQVCHLNRLSSLTELKLDGNSIRHGLETEEKMLTMSSLSMQSCNAEELDVSSYPNLRYLMVDDNRLANIRGISELKDLLVLSMRSQSLSEANALAIFEHPIEARTVRLSGNSMTTLNFTTNFLSIQHLEMASVGLQELPEDFGLNLPNLRTLNLNYNSLKDIRPVLNIQKLEQLSVCGNLLCRLRKSVTTFGKLGTLRSLDLRDNPLTQGFYSNSVAALTNVAGTVCKIGGHDLEDQDARKAEYDLSRYRFPPGDAARDNFHRPRLDEDTELRRRVYEMLMASSCPTIEELDGLSSDRVGAATKDSVWDRLVELGMIRRSQDSIVDLIS